MIPELRKQMAKKSISSIRFWEACLHQELNLKGLKHLFETIYTRNTISHTKTPHCNSTCPHSFRPRCIYILQRHTYFTHIFSLWYGFCWAAQVPLTKSVLPVEATVRRLSIWFCWIEISKDHRTHWYIYSMKIKMLVFSPFCRLCLCDNFDFVFEFQ